MQPTYIFLFYKNIGQNVKEWKKNEYNPVKWKKVMND